MRLRLPASSLLVAALALAGCQSAPVSPSPLGIDWRPTMALPQAHDPAPSPATPGRTAALPAPPAPPTTPSSETGMQYSSADIITFQSDRRPSAGGYDIYAYDAALDTVLSIVGVNTAADETHPRCSDDGRWLVFQRGHAGADQNVLLYNRALRLVNTLSGLNSPGADETEPDISADGGLIVYVHTQDGRSHLRLYDTATGDNFEVPGANRSLLTVKEPCISGAGDRLAYTASSAADPASSDVYLYDLPSASQLTPPFVNTGHREGHPELSADGSRLLFVSNRFGSDDIFEADLASGFTDNFAFLNSDADEQHPRYLGGSVDRLVFQLRVRDAHEEHLAIRAYHRAQALLDTLPVANMLMTNTALGR